MEKKITSTRLKQLTKEVEEKAVPGVLTHIAEDGKTTKLGEVTNVNMEESVYDKKAKEVLPKIDEVT